MTMDSATSTNPANPSKRGFSTLQQVDSLSGRMEDIGRFWEVASAPVAKPSGDVWRTMQQQVHVVVVRAAIYSDPEPLNMAAYNEYQLSRLWAKGNWDGYYDLPIKTLREAVSHYVTPLVEETTQ